MRAAAAAAAGGGQVPGKFRPRPGPAFVVRPGGSGPGRGRTGRVPAAEKFGRVEGQKKRGGGTGSLILFYLLFFFPRPPSLPTSRRCLGVAAAPIPSARIPFLRGGPTLGSAGQAAWLSPAFLGWGVMPGGGGCWSRMGGRAGVGGAVLWAPPKEAQSAASFF